VCVSLKSLLKHHPLSCQLARPTGRTPVAALSGGTTDPGLVLLHGLVPCHMLHLLIVSHLIVLLFWVHPTQDLDKGKYVKKFISKN
jgi:hypothetical protein